MSDTRKVIVIAGPRAGRTAIKVGEDTSTYGFLMAQVRYDDGEEALLAPVEYVEYGEQVGAITIGGVTRTYWVGVTAHGISVSIEQSDNGCIIGRFTSRAAAVRACNDAAITRFAASSQALPGAR